MFFKFPYQYGFIDNRKIPYPIATVFLKTVRGRRAFLFIVDTGADNVTLPYYMMSLLGIKKESLSPNKSQGISKELVNTWEGTIPIELCDMQLNVHCAFTDNNKTPFLLGKEDIFSTFNVLFDNKNQQTVFEKTDG